jgi:hypothetical protein
MDLPIFEFGTAYSKFKGFQNQSTKVELTIMRCQAAWICKLACLYTGNKS